MDLEALVLRKLAGRVELLYALKALATGSPSYREASERYGVSQGALEEAFREVCDGRYQACSRLLPMAVDLVLSRVPSVATRGACGLCGTVVSNMVLHIRRKHGEVVSHYTRLVREEMLRLLRSGELVRAEARGEPKGVHVLPP